MSTREMGIEDARAVLGDLVRDAQQHGMTTIITRNGKRAALIVPDAPQWTYAIEALSGEGDPLRWMPEADAIGTEFANITADQLARNVMASRLGEADDVGPKENLRVVVWKGAQQDHIDMAAAVIYSWQMEDGESEK